MAYVDTIVDRLLPDYRNRHIFTTKLRLVAFIGFWAIFLFFLHDVLDQVTVILVIVFACFFLTGFAYYNIIGERWLLPSFIVELAGDLAAITVMVYLTGGPHSPYFTIYLFYVFVAGAIYNHYLASLVALSSAVFYGSFLLLCHWGIIPPLILDYGDRLPIPAYTPFAHFLFALIFLAGIVYTVKVAIYFSQQRERALEKRNREFMALHRVSSAVRSVAILRDVIDKLLAGVLEGLGFETVILLHFDRERGMVRLYTPRQHARRGDIEAVLGKTLEDMQFPIETLKSPAMAEILKQRTIFRRNLSELAQGWGGVFSVERCDSIQKIMGVRKMVAIPLVVESVVLGALVGFSREPFLEDEQVATFESFANQAAMSLEAAMLIDRLKRVNDQLKEANEVKSEFLATMSHELRTPLTAIIGFSELLMEGVMGDLTEEQCESLQEVLHNAADLLDLINSLLDLTKIESGRMRLDIGVFDIGATVRRVVSTITPLIQKKKQRLSVELADDIPPVNGDERKVQQVLINLLANAIKFTSEKGRIGVAVRYCSDPGDLNNEALTVERLKDLKDGFDNGCIEIIVTDNGIGVSPEDHDRIFEMFHQADGSVTRSFGGTGLGLSLARQFVEMHGGRIWVESEAGKGACFTIVLPVSSIAGGKK